MDQPVDPIKSAVKSHGYAHCIVEGTCPSGTTSSDILKHIDKEHNLCFGGQWIGRTETTFQYKVYTD